MPLVDSSQPAHATALKRFVARLSGGDEVERALLLNLQEEDRLPLGAQEAFHAALAGSKRRNWTDRFTDAARQGQRALAVPTPCPGDICGPWWTHVTLTALQKRGYVSLAHPRASRPPRRLPLKQRIGTGAPFPFWITDFTTHQADDIRDRLGLCHVIRGEQIYKVSIAIAVATSRPLYVPTALDAGFSPAWRHPGAGHTASWGMTRHLETDEASQRELLALPDPADAMAADHVGLVSSDPPRGYLRARGIT